MNNERAGTRAKSGFFSVFPVVAILGVLIASCGGGDGDGIQAVAFSISGRVTSGGAGLSGVTMTLSGAGSDNVTTDASGNYSFTGLDNGTYTITPSRTAYTFTPASSQQTVSGQNIASVNFTATLTQSVLIVACPASGTTNATIQNFTFFPVPVTVAVNGIVKWTNNETSITHTVTSGTSPTPDGTFDSGDLTPGAAVCMQFLVSGTYPYFCTPHPFMIGSVTVQ